MARTARFFVTIYRTGGTENFRWQRALPVATREAAEAQAADLRRQGYPALVEDWARSLAIGLPETFTPGQEVR